MATKTKRVADPRDALIDALLDREEFKVQNALDVNEQIKYLASRLFNRALEAELDQHLGYAKNDDKPEGQNNERNGHTRRSVQSELGNLELSVPRDRDGSFEPAVVPKYQRRVDGINSQILSLYARGMSTREISEFFKEHYAADVSAELISHVTDEVISEIEAWQKEPLEGMYPIVYFDAIRVKVRDEDKVVRPKAIHIALGINSEGKKRVLGLWISATESAKMWLKVFNDLKSRGLNDILIAVTDGLTGLPQALESAYPETKHQTCIVHMVRNSLKWVAWKDYKTVVTALKTIYAAPSVELAESALEQFTSGPLGKKYPEIVQQWRTNWERVIPFFEFSPEIRRMVYTTNTIEAMNRQIRKGIKTRGVFPTDTAAVKLVWLVLQNCEKKWKTPSIHWRQAKHEFSIMFAERFMKYCVD